MFFDTWYDALRPLVVGAIAYVMVVAMLRVSGKRTLAKMNAYDLVVTVALGSTLATIALSADVSLVEGAVALGLLCGAQFLVAYLSVRSRAIRRAVRSEPKQLVHRGKLAEEAMKQSRVTEGEILQAIRSSGQGSVEGIAAVVMETDGSFSVITEEQMGTGSALADVGS